MTKPTIATGTETVPLLSARAAIADGLNMLNRSTPPQLNYGVEWIDNDGEPWARITLDGNTFGTWPEPVAVAVCEAMGYAAMVAHSYVKGYQK